MAHDNQPSHRPPTRGRALAAGLYRRVRVDLGLTQLEAAHVGNCGERSQRDRELGDCCLGALESMVEIAASQGKRLRLVLESAAIAPANDNAEAGPPSLRPLTKCRGHVTVRKAAAR